MGQTIGLEGLEGDRKRYFYLSYIRAQIARMSNSGSLSTWRTEWTTERIP